MRARTITERNIAIQERARRGEPLAKLADEFGLAPGTVYMITSKRRSRPAQKPDDVDPFIKYDRAAREL